MLWTWKFCQGKPQAMSRVSPREVSWASSNKAGLLKPFGLPLLPLRVPNAGCGAMGFSVQIDGFCSYFGPILSFYAPTFPFWKWNGSRGHDILKACDLIFKFYRDSQLRISEEILELNFWQMLDDWGFGDSCRCIKCSLYYAMGVSLWGMGGMIRFESKRPPHKVTC
jgi:hypothetical protein